MTLDMAARTTLTSIVVLFFVAWVWNVVKFVSCDFESDFRCEAIHATGVFMPLAAFATVWFDDDGEN